MLCPEMYFKNNDFPQIENEQNFSFLGQICHFVLA